MGVTSDQSAHQNTVDTSEAYSQVIVFFLIEWSTCLEVVHCPPVLWILLLPSFHQYGRKQHGDDSSRCWQISTPEVEAPIKTPPPKKQDGEFKASGINGAVWRHCNLLMHRWACHSKMGVLKQNQCLLPFALTGRQHSITEHLPFCLRRDKRSAGTEKSTRKRDAITADGCGGNS